MPPKRRGTPARGAGEKKRRTRLDENQTQEDQRMEQSQGMALVYNKKMEKLSSVYSKLWDDLADPKRYGEDFATELSNFLPNYWKVINASKQDLVRKDCEIVVAGEVSSGKTTLVNYLLGPKFNDLLEVKLLASTGYITRIRNSETETVHIYNKDGMLLQQIPLKQFKRFQEKELATLKGAYFVDVYLPVSFLKGNVILVDTPGIGDAIRRDEMLLEILPNAVAFIYVINARNAGGIADDRIGRILQKVSANTNNMPCFDKCDAIFLTNQWDSVEDALFRAEDKDKEVDETWNKIKSQIEKWEKVPSDNIFQISLKEVFERKKTKYTDEYDRFEKKLKNTIERNENKRVKRYLDYIQNFYVNASTINKERLKRATESESGVNQKFKETEERIQTIRSLTDRAKQNIKKSKKDCVVTLSKRLNNRLKDSENKILNPEDKIQMKDVSFQNIPEEVYERVQKFIREWFQTTEVQEIILQAIETFKNETMPILEGNREIALDLEEIAIPDFNTFVNNVNNMLAKKNVGLSMVGGVATGAGLGVCSVPLAASVVSGGLIAAGIYIFRKSIGIETASWFTNQSYSIAVQLVISTNIPEKYVGKKFDDKITLCFDTEIPEEIKKLEKVQKDVKNEIGEINRRKVLYLQLDEKFKSIEEDLEELQAM